MRRRMFLMGRRSELLTHIHMTYQQYNLDCPNKLLRYAGNREGLPHAEWESTVTPPTRQDYPDDAHRAFGQARAAAYGRS